jgi:uncharacterized protein YbjT (DUF2867 family)
MKIVIIGSTGLIGSQVAQNLRGRGHEAVPASPDTGGNTITGESLDAAQAGAQVFVDVANSPSFEDAAVLEFFQTSGRNLLKAAVNAGVGHHVEHQTGSSLCEPPCGPPTYQGGGGAFREAEM